MKKIIITGASSGLGNNLVEVYKNNGYEVIGVGRNSSGKKIPYVNIDFTDEKSILDGAKKITSEKEIQAIIICAGIGEIEKIGDLNYKKNSTVFEVNILGQNILLSNMADFIKENGIDIIFIGATIGFKADKFMPFYSITKWGLRGMIENWREYLKGSDSRVIGIHPGGLDTNSNIGEHGRAKKISEITQQKLGTFLPTDEIAKLIYTISQLPKNMEVSEILINRK